MRFRARRKAPCLALCSCLPTYSTLICDSAKIMQDSHCILYTYCVLDVFALFRRHRSFRPSRLFVVVDVASLSLHVILMIGQMDRGHRRSHVRKGTGEIEQRAEEGYTYVHYVLLCIQAAAHNSPPFCGRHVVTCPFPSLAFFRPSVHPSVSLLKRICSK